MSDNNRRVLVVEDDQTSARLLYNFLTSKGIETDEVHNGREALEKTKHKDYNIVITDIEMPVMDGNQLIDNLNKMDIPPVIFVTTAHNEPDLIIDIMKKGVYDYIIKPVDMTDLLLKLKRAFEAYSMKRSLEIIEREKVIRLEKQLEWYKWEERARTRDNKALGDTLFSSLQMSFNQGAGFGALVSLVNIISETAQRDGDNYIIPKELFDVITQNARMAEKALQTFSDIEQIISKKYKLKPFKIQTLYNETSELIKELSTMSAIKNHKIILSEAKESFAVKKVNIMPEHIRKAMYEILINAMKFSRNNSDIIVFFEIKEKELIISVLNEPFKDDNGRRGIPMEYENIVFEPFFRLTNSIQENYKTLDYGLGLTLVEKIITRQKGRINIFNITDHSDIQKGPGVKVNCSVSLPVN